MSSCRFVTANPRLWVSGLLACCTILLFSGCGPDYKARGAVKGKVTLGTKSLTTGTVMFMNKAGLSASASITPDGNYDMPDAPLGECTVTVTVQALPVDSSVRARLKGKGPAMPAGPKMPENAGNPENSSPELPSGPNVPKEVVTIDAKYSNPDTSGLKFTVNKGEQTYNIEL